MNRIQFRAWYPERQKMYVVAKADKGEPINSITHKFEVDKENPRIEVKIHEKEIQLNPKT